MASERLVSMLRLLPRNFISPTPVARRVNFSICTNCRKQLQKQQKRRLISISHRQPFSTTLPQRKKKGNKGRGSSDESEEHVPDNKATRERDAEIDPYDHSALEAGIANALSRFQDSLAKTRDAGRVTAEMIEILPVELNVKHPEQPKSKGQPDKPHHEHTKLGHIASVVPKGGRMMQVFAAEQGHVKPLTSAIMASPHSLNPEVDKNNPLLILVPVPPATAETRSQAAVEVKKCFDKASLEVRNARGDAQKRHRKMEKEKLVIMDELMKAHKSMEEVAKKGQNEVQKLYDGALKALQQ